jgi:hypothetical protein
MRVSDAYGAVAELAASQHGAFTRSQAAAIGITSRDLAAVQRAGWARPTGPEVFVLRWYPATFEQRVKAATLLRKGGPVASHRTAAALHHLDGFKPSVVELTVVTGQAFRQTGVVVHEAYELDACDITQVDGIPVTTIARTLADLGSVVDEDAVLQALDDARRRRVSLRWMRSTALRLHRPGQHGTSVLLGLLDHAELDTVVPDSWFERLVERCLHSPLLPPLERQYVVRDGRGRFLARVDLAFPTLKLAVEAHSRRYHQGRGPEAGDEARDHRLAANGWEVLYVGWQAHRHPDELLELVLRSAAHRPRST